MNAAFIRCLARVLSMAAGSLSVLLPADGWASFVTYSKADSTFLPTRRGGATRPAFSLFAPIRDVSVRPP